MKTLATVSIGIPAHNEEGSILRLINDLLKQRAKTFVLNSIDIYTDGCTDKTAALVGTYAKSHKKVVLHHDGKRVGKPARLNQFFKESSADIVVALDADIIPENNFLIENLIKPFIDNPQTASVSGKALPHSPKTPSEHIAMSMFRVWERTTRRSGEKMFLCEGSVRAFSRSLYERMRFPEDSSADDVFPFLYAAQHRLVWVHAPLAKVRFRLPSSFVDYIKVSSRYLQADAIQASHFPKSLIESHYTISILDRLISLAIELVKHPFSGLAYLFTLPIPRLLHYIDKRGRSSTWDSARTTKARRTHVVFSTYDDLQNPYYAGGGAYAIHEVAKRLVKHYDITIVTSRHANASHNQIIDGIVYKRIGYTPHFFPPLGQLIFVLLTPFTARFAKFDLWVESFTPPFSVSLLPLCCRRPIIGLIHMLSAQEMTRKYHLPFSLIENLGLKLYKNFIVMSQVTADKILKVNKRATIAVIPNGVYPPKLNKVTKKNQICFVGRLEYSQKGLDLLIDSFAKIIDQTDWQLVIGGSGPKYEEDRLISHISKLNLSSRVNLLGRVDKTTRDRIYKESEFIAIPSRYETFSLVALEALSYGLPILRFDINGMDWLPDDGNIKVKSFDVDSYAKQMLKLIKMPKVRSVMSQTNRLHAKHYSWNNISAQYQFFIDQSL